MGTVASVQPNIPAKRSRLLKMDLWRLLYVQAGQPPAAIPGDGRPFAAQFALMEECRMSRGRQRHRRAAVMRGPDAAISRSASVRPRTTRTTAVGFAARHDACGNGPSERAFQQAHGGFDVVHGADDGAGVLASTMSARAQRATRCAARRRRKPPSRSSRKTTSSITQRGWRNTGARRKNIRHGHEVRIGMIAAVERRR